MMDKASEDSPDPVAEQFYPGGGMALYRGIVRDGGSGRGSVLQLLSRISSAIRARAADQKRSAERSETARLSAVSATVKPAK